jgi:hypothetical protein
MCDCFCDEKIGLCVEVVCDEKEVARARGEHEQCAVHSRVHVELRRIVAPEGRAGGCRGTSPRSPMTLGL